MEIRVFAEADRVAVIDLWHRCGLIRAWNDPDLDVDRKVAQDAAGVLVVEDDARIVGAAMYGHDGLRGSVGYLAVEPELMGTGVGRLLMGDIEDRLEAMGCPKVNLLVRNDNADVVAFYERLDYAPDATISMGKRLIPDVAPQ
ncbi:MAG: GNAT family acetyltransferase [Acidimicrobiales bacterium]|jgi:ribosomal protein S18 acetylase RimI-like enzyme|nr:GNAT family acetyltransferase [Acidimicrobiales bacterium]